MHEETIKVITQNIELMKNRVQEADWELQKAKAALNAVEQESIEALIDIKFFSCLRIDYRQLRHMAERRG
jgi:hypothetical protein